MRILHAINQMCGSAGAEISLRDILLASHGKEFVHAVVVLRTESNVLEPFERSGIRCFVPDRPTRARSGQIRHIRAAIRDFRPDLVHTSLFDADLAGRLACFAEGVPVVSSFVNTPFASWARAAEPATAAKLKAVYIIDGLLARHLTSGFHAISRAAAAHATEHLRVPASAIRVVPRGRSRLELGEPSVGRRAEVRERLGWRDRPIVLNVARQEPQKGQRFLIEAFTTVVEAEPDALLVLAGREGRSTPELETLIASLDLDASVDRLRVRTDVADLLSAADVFAFPSLYEGLGGAALEAMGLGIPIVASDIPALRELLDDRAWLVPPGDVPTLASALCEVLAGGDEIVRRSQAGRQVFLARYELEVCVRGMDQLYRDVGRQLAGGKRRRYRRPPRLRISESS